MMSRRPPRTAFAGWWLIAFGLCCAKCLVTLQSDVFLLEPASIMASSSLSLVVWELPVLRVGILQDGLLVSKWLAAAIAAALIVWLLNRLARRRSIGFSVVVIALLASAWAPEHLLTWFWLIIIGPLLQVDSDCRWTWRHLVLGLIGLVGSAVTTVDFSMVLILVLVSVSDKILRERRRTGKLNRPALTLVVIALTASVVASFSLDGFANTLLRPLTAMQMAVLETPFAGLEPVTSSWLESLLLAATISLVIGDLQNSLSADPSGRPNRIGLLIVLGVGVFCRYYIPIVMPVLLFYSAFGHMKLLQAQKPPASLQLPTQWVLRFVVVLSVIGITAIHTIGLRPVLSANPFRQRLVNLKALTGEVKVLLMSPGMTSHWKGPEAPLRTQLLLDDRWDRFRPGQAETVQQVFADFARGRREIYLLENGESAGARRWIDSQKPDLLVLSSNDWTAIRQLSLNPNWNVIAIDGRRTVFATADRPDLNMRAGDASRLWFFLEWPNPRSQVSLEGFLEPGLDSDSVKVAGVLNAMRLPYAALRVLPDVDSFEADLQRAWSYTELVVRCARQNGRTSLLDLIRARKLIDQLRAQRRPSGIVPEKLERLELALKKAVDLKFQPRVQTPGSDSSGAKGRRYVLEGRFKEAEDIGVDASVNSDARMVSILLTGLKGSADNWQDRLRGVADSPDCPVNVRHEILFYLGCLALENREVEQAVSCFQQALATPDGFSNLCQLYLSQLTR